MGSSYPACGMGVAARSWDGKQDLFGLAPDGVYLATLIAQGTVSSYLTFSPLPCGMDVAAIPQGGIFLWHFPYLCEISTTPLPRNSPCYGPSCPAELGLSSPPDLPHSQDLRRSGHLFPFDSPPFLKISKNTEIFDDADYERLHRFSNLFLSLLRCLYRSPRSPNGLPLYSLPSGWTRSQRMRMFSSSVTPFYGGSLNSNLSPDKSL